MSELTCSRSGYTVEYLNQDKIWKQVEIDYDGAGPVPAALWEHEGWINTMLRVMSYEAAVATIALAKAQSFEASLCTQYRIRRWDVTYTLKAVQTEDTAMFCNNLFSPDKGEKE